MFTSNKKKEKQAVGASVFMLCRVFITFYSLNCPQITLRFILGSCCFSKPFSNSPVSIYAKALHFSWWHSHSTQKKRAEQSKDTLSLFYCPLFHCQMCIFTRNTANIHAAHTFMAKTQICRCFIAFYFIFYLEKNSLAHGVVRMICCHTV